MTTPQQEAYAAQTAALTAASAATLLALYEAQVPGLIEDADPAQVALFVGIGARLLSIANRRAATLADVALPGLIAAEPAPAPAAPAPPTSTPVLPRQAAPARPPAPTRPLPVPAALVPRVQPSPVPQPAPVPAPPPVRVAPIPAAPARPPAAPVPPPAARPAPTPQPLGLTRPDDEPDRLAEALEKVVTAAADLRVEGEHRVTAQRGRVERIGRAEPARAAQEALHQGMRRRRVLGWLRVISPTACERCQTWADGKVRPPSVRMKIHLGCGCLAQPIASNQEVQRDRTDDREPVASRPDRSGADTDAPDAAG